MPRLVAGLSFCPAAVGLSAPLYSVFIPAIQMHVWSIFSLLCFRHAATQCGARFTLPRSAHSAPPCLVPRPAGAAYAPADCAPLPPFQRLAAPGWIRAGEPPPADPIPVPAQLPGPSSPRPGFSQSPGLPARVRKSLPKSQKLQDSRKQTPPKVARLPGAFS